MPDMRFAPPPSLRIADRSGGMNQMTVRSFNERLIMSLLLQNEGMTRLAIGQASGLSAQTISVIVRALERDGFVSPGVAVRGRVGPPTVPVRLNPEGAFSIGVNIETCNLDVVLIDFVGEIKFRNSVKYTHPDCQEIARLVLELIGSAISTLSPDKRARVAGVGLTLPVDIDDRIASGNKDSLANFDFESLIRDATGLDVYIQDNITAAASAESMFGAARGLNDYLFCFAGPQISTRLILGNRIYAGEPPNALDDNALALLDRLLDIRAADPALEAPGAIELTEEFDELSQIVITLSKFVSIKTVILGGLLPQAFGRDISQKIQSQLEDHYGTDHAPSLKFSLLGPWLLAMGAACLTFHSRFMAENTI